MNRLLPLLAGAAVVCAARTDASACSVLGPSPYVIDTSMQATDHVAPTLAPPSVASLQRGTATGGACSRNSCDGMGSLALTIAVSDDVTPATNLGYRFSLAAGALPAAARSPARIRAGWPGSWLRRCYWPGAGAPRERDKPLADQEVRDPRPRPQ